MSGAKLLAVLNGISVLVNDDVGVLLQALSNQKYREMYEQFKDVGLMTGDVTINPSASCIVMTTEVGMRDEDEGTGEMDCVLDRVLARNLLPKWCIVQLAGMKHPLHTPLVTNMYVGSQDSNWFRK